MPPVFAIPSSRHPGQRLHPNRLAATIIGLLVWQPALPRNIFVDRSSPLRLAKPIPGDSGKIKKPNENYQPDIMDFHRTSAPAFMGYVFSILKTVLAATCLYTSTISYILNRRPARYNSKKNTPLTIKTVAAAPP